LRLVSPREINRWEKESVVKMDDSELTPSDSEALTELLETTAPAKKSGGGLFVGMVSTLLVVGLVAGGAWWGMGALSEIVSRFQVEDYEGQGEGEATIVIAPGDSGEAVARKMVEADIVKSFEAIYRPMLRTNFIIYPGTYVFPTQIPGTRALEILIEGKNRVVLSVTVPEGFTNRAIVERLAQSLSLSADDLEAAIAEIELPESAPNAEGWLFPATYQFDPGVTAVTVIQTLHARMLAELRSFGVTEDQYLETLTIASLIQLEAKLAADFFKVSRVIQNRLDINMPLQFDSTVNYGTGGTRVTTTDQQRADQNPYNTYVYPGLPIGPIGNPGSLAIESALAPADGPWLYFVTINLATGETVFSNTYAEHLVAVEEFRRWIRANPSWNQ
jgi:UPF0755 protein